MRAKCVYVTESNLANTGRRVVVVKQLANVIAL